jgi:hypothetical protein
MGDLVKTQSRDLIFQPTEILAEKVLLEQERRAEYEEKYDDALRRWHRSRLWTFGFGGVAFSSALAAGLVWVLASTQIAKAEDARDTALEREVVLQDDLDENKAVASTQSDELINLGPYRDLAYLHDDVVNKYMFTLDEFRASLKGYGDRLPREVLDAMEFRSAPKYTPDEFPDISQWVLGTKSTLEDAEDDLRAKVEVVEKYIRTRQLTVPIRECFPKKVFGGAAERCRR